MSLWATSLIVGVVVAAALAIVFLARKRVPPGGLIKNNVTASSALNVLGTAYAVLLAFVIFLAFESYTTARDRSSAEAVAVTELYRSAQLFSEPTRSEVQAQLACYARAVIHQEWPAMREVRTSPVVEQWITRLDGSVDAADITGERQQAGYANWLDVATERREGRRGRLAEAAPFVPQALWVVLLLGAGLVIGFLCLYADPAERFFVQAMMIGSVTAMIVVALLFVRFLDGPYKDLPGSIRPVEMTRTLTLIEEDLRSRRPDMVEPCDQQGMPTNA